MPQTDKIRPPGRDEYDDYYHRYISLVPEGDIIDVLTEQLSSGLELLDGIPGELMDHVYAPGKWTAGQVIGHLIDAERVFAFRALHFARGDGAPLPGMDQERWMSAANFKDRSLQSLMVEWRHLRASNIVLFDSFDRQLLDRTGIADGRTFTVRATLYIIAGHYLHHIDILRERYFS